MEYLGNLNTQEPSGEYSAPVLEDLQLDFRKNELMNMTLMCFYETYKLTLDTQDFVSVKVDNFIERYITKNLERKFKEIDKVYKASVKRAKKQAKIDKKAKKRLLKADNREKRKQLRAERKSKRLKNKRGKNEDNG